MKNMVKSIGILGWVSACGKYLSLISTMQGFQAETHFHFSLHLELHLHWSQQSNTCNCAQKEAGRKEEWILSLQGKYPRIVFKSHQTTVSSSSHKGENSSWSLLW
jgi:hypothetical protein